MTRGEEGRAVERSRQDREGAARVSREAGRGLSREQALRLVAQALERVQYGEIIVKMQGGKPMWVDTYERTRVG